MSNFWSRPETKWAQKTVKKATEAQLLTAEADLARSIPEERNSLRRTSLEEQLDIVRDEMRRRTEIVEEQHA